MTCTHTQSGGKRGSGEKVQERREDKQSFLEQARPTWLLGGKCWLEPRSNANVLTPGRNIIVTFYITRDNKT